MTTREVQQTAPPAYSSVEVDTEKQDEGANKEIEPPATAHVHDQAPAAVPVTATAAQTTAAANPTFHPPECISLLPWLLMLALSIGLALTLCNICGSTYKTNPSSGEDESVSPPSDQLRARRRILGIFALYACQMVGALAGGFAVLGFTSSDPAARKPDGPIRCRNTGKHWHLVGMFIGGAAVTLIAAVAPMLAKHKVAGEW